MPIIEVKCNKCGAVEEAILDRKTYDDVKEGSTVLPCDVEGCGGLTEPIFSLGTHKIAKVGWYCDDLL